MGRYNKGGVKYALPMRSKLKVLIVPFEPLLKGHDAAASIDLGLQPKVGRGD